MTQASQGKRASLAAAKCALMALHSAKAREAEQAAAAHAAAWRAAEQEAAQHWAAWQVAREDRFAVDADPQVELTFWEKARRAQDASTRLERVAREVLAGRDPTPDEVAFAERVLAE